MCAWVGGALRYGDGVPLSFMSPAEFQEETQAALSQYDRHIVAIDKTPDEAAAVLTSLITKAIKAYEERGPGLRHGIALDRHLTVILSEQGAEKPICGIYFNLRSPYMVKARG